MSGNGAARGWGAVIALALAASALSVVRPILLMFLPLALMLMALPPRRLPLVGLGVLLAAIAALDYRPEALWYAERGWALLLGAWFVLMVVAMPRASFISRGLAATAATVGSATLLFLANPRGWQALDWTVGRSLRDNAADAATLLGSGSELSQFSQQVSSAIYSAAEMQAKLYPSLLALGSLAALAVAWWMFRRLAEREPAPLGRLREFRFRDELVWMLIAALLLIVLPVGGTGRWAGSNVLAFMLALYSLRGLAVLLSLTGARGAGSVLVGGLALVLFYPLVMAATLVVGVSDTWLDLRSRRSRQDGVKP